MEIISTSMRTSTPATVLCFYYKTHWSYYQKISRSHLEL